jgi:FMN phosphatase YigB (HAD superfamily)
VLAKPSPIKAILFDLDNTLLDRDAGFVRFCQWLHRNHKSVNQSQVEEEICIFFPQA